MQNKTDENYFEDRRKSSLMITQTSTIVIKRIHFSALSKQNWIVFSVFKHFKWICSVNYLRMVERLSRFKIENSADRWLWHASKLFDRASWNVLCANQNCVRLSENKSKQTKCLVIEYHWSMFNIFRNYTIITYLTIIVLIQLFVDQITFERRNQK